MMEASKKVNDSVQATEMSNLMILAPHKAKYYRRYNIQWLIEQVENGKQFKYVTFWKADEGEENNVFSQWYRGKPFAINGRTYVTAEQYMMSEKALLFNDLTMYSRIMNEPDSDQCKQLGRLVKGFVGHIWEDAFREIIFHGNLGKLQSDIEIVDALLKTGNAVLVEASPDSFSWERRQHRLRRERRIIADDELLEQLDGRKLRSAISAAIAAENADRHDGEQPDSMLRLRDCFSIFKADKDDQEHYEKYCKGVLPSEMNVRQIRTALTYLSREKQCSENKLVDQRVWFFCPLGLQV